MKYKIIMIMICLYTTIVYSQEEEKLNLRLRHLKGMQAIEAKVMFAKIGVAYELNYGYYVNSKILLHVGLNYERSKLEYSDLQYRNIKLGATLSFKEYKNRFFINGMISGLIGQIVTDRAIIDTKTTKFNFGIVPGINTEFYLFNTLSIILSYEQQINIKDPFGITHFNFGGGLRYYIN